MESKKSKMLKLKLEFLGEEGGENGERCEGEEKEERGEKVY
ncbi:hypothetical protein [Staphylococcus epidermidis]|nr:hypothetical protein [Staphylococcus epidermidis]